MSARSSLYFAPVLTAFMYRSLARQSDRWKEKDRGEDPCQPRLVGVTRQPPAHSAAPWWIHVATSRSWFAWMC